MARLPPDLHLQAAERAAASAALDQVLALSDFAAIIRFYPEYQAPAAMLEAIRAVVTVHGDTSKTTLTKVKATQ